MNVFVKSTRNECGEVEPVLERIAKLEACPNLTAPVETVRPVSVESFISLFLLRDDSLLIWANPRRVAI
jgi:hypothetical protein